MSKQNESSPRKSLWRSIASRVSWDLWGALIASFLAYELGRAHGFKDGVRGMWQAEMAILHALADKSGDDAGVSGL